MVAAKLSGVDVLEFAIGLGPAIFKKKIGETTYALRALPFGGQCVMRGEDDADGKENDHPRSFANAKPWKKLIILCAGAFMNFITGYVIFLCLFCPVETYSVPEIASFMEQFTGGGEMGLQPGDRILEIDGYNIYIKNDISVALSRGKNAPYYDIEVDRDGKRIELQDIEISPKTYIEDGKEVSKYGVTLQSRKMTFFENLKLSWYSSVNMVRLVFISLGDLFTGTVKITALSGVVGISAVMSNTAKQSMLNFWYLSALIAINLSVMNLLPFPALDGGRAVFVLYEIITRRRVNQKFEIIVSFLGLLLLFGLMIFVTFNDITRLIFN